VAVVVASFLTRNFLLHLLLMALPFTSAFTFAVQWFLFPTLQLSPSLLSIASLPVVLAVSIILASSFFQTSLPSVAFFYCSASFPMFILEAKVMEETIIIATKTAIFNVFSSM